MSTLPGDWTVTFEFNATDAFGTGGDTYLRICYAKSPALLGEALDRLATVLD